MVERGMKASFIPHFIDSVKLTPAERRAATVTANVVSVNEKHRNFICEWKEGDTRLRESFLFSEIGKKVTIIG